MTTLSDMFACQAKSCSFTRHRAFFANTKDRYINERSKLVVVLNNDDVNTYFLSLQVKTGPLIPIETSEEEFHEPKFLKWEPFKEDMCEEECCFQGRLKKNDITKLSVEEYHI